MGLIFCRLDDWEVQTNCIELYISMMKCKNLKTQKTMHRFISNNKDLKFRETLMKLMDMKVDKIIDYSQSSAEYYSNSSQKLKAASADDVASRESLNDKSSSKLPFKEVEQSCKDAANYWLFLSFLCQGQYTSSQDMLRERSEEGLSFFHYSIKTYGKFSKYVSRYTLPLILQIIDFLMQMIKGPNPGNQQVILQSKFFDHMKEYFEEFEDVRNTKEESKCQQLELIISKTVNLALCAVEGHSLNRDVFYEISRNIQVESLAEIIHRSLIRLNVGFTNNEKPTLNQLSKSKVETSIVFGEDLSSIFQLYFFIQYMADNLEDHFENIWSTVNDYQLASLNWLQEYTGSVEVVFQNKLEVVYFIKQPATFFISKEDKAKYLQRSGKNSHLNKLYMMLEYSKEIEFTADYHYRVSHTRGFVIKMWKYLSYVVDHILLFVAICCNVLVGFTDNHQVGYFRYDDNHLIFVVVRFVMISVCFIRLITHIVIRTPLEMGIGWNMEIEKNLEQIKKVQRVYSNLNR